MRRYAAPWVFVLAALLSYCTPEDEEITTDPDRGLVFSTDTIFFDTVLTDLRTATRRLRVSNPNDRAVRLRRVRMENADSPFSLIVNGQPGPTVEGLVLRGGDSLLVVVDALIDPRNLDDSVYIVSDRVIVEVEGRDPLENTVEVVAYGEDANYLRNVVLPCATVWTAERPYVLFGQIVLDTNCTLTLEPGTRVFCAPGAELLVFGQLRMEGTPENRIQMSSIRRDGGRREAPGQWSRIVMVGNSQGNLIRYATVQNATFGVQLGVPLDDDRPSLLIHNSVVKNMSSFGLWGFNPEVVAFNNQFLNAGQYNALGQSGGTYFFVHNTFAYSNSPGLNFIRRTPSVAFSDRFVEDNQVLDEQPLTLLFVNNIVSGGEDAEFALAADGVADTILIDHNYLKTDDYPFDTLNNVLSTSPFPFNNRLAFEFFPDTLATPEAPSPARDVGLPLTSPLLDDLRQAFPDLNVDFAARPREAEAPDLGAYEIQD